MADRLLTPAEFAEVTNSVPENNQQDRFALTAVVVDSKDSNKLIELAFDVTVKGHEISPGIFLLEDSEDWTAYMEGEE
jgi:hypothetical protein